MQSKPPRLTLERLEDRNLLSVYYGLPWPDAGQLTVSFVPDGTSVDGNHSALFQTFNATGSSKVWETAMLQAIQSWASQGNINVGLVADGGQPLGTPGLDQGDSRFGDIRIAAEPLGANGPVAITAPYDPLAGTRSGDIVFNSSLKFSIGGTATSYDVFTAALHEAGHVFNLPDQTTDPTSVMYANYQGPEAGPSPGDIALLQSIYGSPAPDLYQGTPGNGTLGTASAMLLPEIAGNITAPGQSEFFKFQIPGYANSSVKVTVHTAGVSLFTPSLSIYNASGQLIATSSNPDPLSGDVTIGLNSVTRGSVFYFQVTGASNNAFGAGGYRLQVNSGMVSQLQIAAIDIGLEQPSVQYVNFNRATATLGTANALDQPVYQIDSRFDYAIHAQLNDAGDVNYFSVVAPASGTKALIVTASPGRCSTALPQVTVYDANGNPVNAQVLSNDRTSGYVVQVLNPVANATYYFAVTANTSTGGTSLRNYTLGVNFAQTPIVLQTIVNDTLSSTNRVDVTYFQSNEVQLFDFVLAVHTGSSVPGIAVQMQLFDANGSLVMTLTCQDGQTISGNTLLGKGLYAVRFVALGANGATIPATAYSLLGLSLTDHLDPVPIDPNNPTNPPPPPTDSDPSLLVVVTPTTPPILPPLTT